MKLLNVVPILKVVEDQTFFFMSEFISMLKNNISGRLGGSVVELLPLVQVVSWDQVPHQASLREPASSSTYVPACLYVCLS